ncbi:DUF1467 family protein [Halodurantibacterium flavum]|uniref:DUF1467 family protein n=1 Tax=Halodurantibacterium flavum TaxID=1382802 RepID=A0ABW4S1I0_9RHOB
MSIVSAAVLFAVIWFLVLFVVLPLRLTSQGEAGAVVPGTPSSAPSDPGLGPKVRIVTVAALVIWAVIASIILFSGLTVRDIDWFDRMPPLPAAATDGTGG